MRSRYGNDGCLRMENCFLDLSSAKELANQTEDESTLSLPSLSLNARIRAANGVAPPDGTSRMTIRDSERALEDLKRENFALKLRIYCLERNDVTTGDSKRTADEFQRLSRDFEESQQLLIQLMTHLHAFCRLFRAEGDDTRDDARRRLSHLLDASEDLLNCAEVLVKNDKDDVWPTLAPPVVHSSAESDDIWSEPDRDASRARIGLAEAPPSGQRPPKASKASKRRQSGEKRSSLGLLDLESNCARLSAETQTPDNRDDKRDDKGVQTTTHDDNDLNDEFRCQFSNRLSTSDSLFAFCASLSPLKSRTKHLVPNIPSSLSSEMSPDLGIALRDDERRLLVPIKHLKRLRTLLNAETGHGLSAEALRRAAALARDCLDGEWADDAWERAERMRRSKERMERVITRALHTTEGLLWKTAKELN